MTVSAIAPDRRIRQMIYWLEQLAQEAADVKGYLAERIARSIDGDDADTDDVRVARSRGTSTTEGHALNAYHYRQQLAELEDRIDGLAISIRGTRTYVRSVYSPADIDPRPVCRDGGFNKDGAIEWHDPDCHRLAVRHGLCDMHRMRWVRWKRDHGQDTSHFYEPRYANA